MHSRDPHKNWEEFWQVIMAILAQTGETHDFTGFVFTEDANFSGATFSGDADFFTATFTQEANFNDAKFNRDT